MRERARHAVRRWVGNVRAEAGKGNITATFYLRLRGSTRVRSPWTHTITIRIGRSASDASAWAQGRGPLIPLDWRDPGLDRRGMARVEYRRTAPGLLRIDELYCAVRDLGPGGLRIEPAPAGRVWYAGQRIAGELRLRSGEPTPVVGFIGRVDRAGLALLPVHGPWPVMAAIEAERASLARSRPERRAAPRLPLHTRGLGPGGIPTPLRDVSATGLRYALGEREAAPHPGSRLEGELRLDSETVIAVRGRVVRQGGREVAVALDAPGLSPEVLTILRERFFPHGEPSVPGARASRG